MKKPVFTAAALVAHQEKNGFTSHYIPTSVEQLARYHRAYAAKRAVFDALFHTLNDHAAQITVQTMSTEVKLLVPQELLEAAIQPLLDDLEKDLRLLEKWVLEQAAYVEKGANECGLDASEEQWAVSTFLAQPVADTPPQGPFLAGAPTPLPKRRTSKSAA